VTTNIRAVFYKVPQNPDWAQSDDLPLIVMTGLGEALSPACTGFLLLSVSWLLVAFGCRRLAAAL